MVLNASCRNAFRCSNKGLQLLMLEPKALKSCDFEMPSVFDEVNTLTKSKALEAINSG